MLRLHELEAKDYLLGYEETEDNLEEEHASQIRATTAESRVAELETELHWPRGESYSSGILESSARPNRTFWYEMMLL